ncbi:Anti-sigma-K factor RskA [Friedmanniella luteola]|uniref:Anti-sigma-K factor RskA n=1 Tax=Friedmanniella luteola TaxID=546871 RepID=A0A1H1W2X7_9ACTN|nr:anti-sigma factor [Friedmanniella luteola]SDS91011.1 Anti-sigma-K factor RskA [Friedmanniella luteola]
MRHLDEETLAGIALGEPDQPSARDRAHLLVCPTCAETLHELQALVATGRAEKPGPVRPPGAGVLAAIQAELAADRTSAAPAAPASEPVPAVSSASVAVLDRHRRDRSGSSTPRRLLAAAAVVLVAAGGAFWYRAATADVLLASTTLASLPDHSGSGTAQLTEHDGDLRLTVDVTRPPAGDAFEELWLINTDGRRMISLGVVPPDGRGSYPVPLTEPGLDGYTVVDISLEPFDGNAAHSRNSLLRGTLG